MWLFEQIDGWNNLIAVLEDVITVSEIPILLDRSLNVNPPTAYIRPLMCQRRRIQAGSFNSDFVKQTGRRASLSSK